MSSHAGMMTAAVCNLDDCIFTTAIQDTQLHPHCNVEFKRCVEMVGTGH